VVGPCPLCLRLCFGHVTAVLGVAVPPITGTVVDLTGGHCSCSETARPRATACRVAVERGKVGRRTLVRQADLRVRGRRARAVQCFSISAGPCPRRAGRVCPTRLHAPAQKRRSHRVQLSLRAALRHSRHPRRCRRPQTPRLPGERRRGTRSACHWVQQCYARRCWRMTRRTLSSGSTIAASRGKPATSSRTRASYRKLLTTPTSTEIA